MNLAQQLLKERGYESTGFNTKLFLERVSTFFRLNGPNDTLSIQEGYFGNYRGEVHDNGFCDDIEGKYRPFYWETWSAFRHSYNEDFSKNDEYNRQYYDVFEKKFGSERLMVTLELYEPSIDLETYEHQIKFVADMLVNKEHAGKMVELLRQEGFKVRKRARDGWPTKYSVSLL